MKQIYFLISDDSNTTYIFDSYENAADFLYMYEDKMEFFTEKPEMRELEDDEYDKFIRSILDCADYNEEYVMRFFMFSDKRHKMHYEKNSGVIMSNAESDEELREAISLQLENEFGIDNVDYSDLEQGATLDYYARKISEKYRDTDYDERAIFYVIESISDTMGYSNDFEYEPEIDLFEDDDEDDNEININRDASQNSMDNLLYEILTTLKHIEKILDKPTE